MIAGLTPTERTTCMALLKKGKTLVRLKPSDLSVYRRLGDGQSHFVVRDVLKRGNVEDHMVKLDNCELPDGGTWFRLGDFWLQLYYAGWHRDGDL